MVRSAGPVHVASIRVVRKGKVYQSHLLRRTFREGGKVKHQTLGNLSRLPPEVIELIKGALRGETYVPRSEAFEIIRSLPHGHVAAVMGAMDNLGIPELLATRPSKQRDMVVAMLASRVTDPCSKLATSLALTNESGVTTLGETLKLGKLDEDGLYRAMDWLVARQGWIEGKLAKRHLADGSLILYDLTSTYYTGNHCSLAQFGHNRDGKEGFPQVVWGLLCNRDGCPVAVEVFEGNVADPKTLGAQIRKIRERFRLERVVLVGDRGVITEARIQKELSPVDGLDWISALRAPAIQALAEAGTVQLSLFDQRDLVEVISPDYPGERLIACRNPLLAEERARKREELLQATERELDKIVLATRRQKARLKGKERIGLRVGKVLNRYKVGKHFCLNIADEEFSYERAGGKIAAESALDGIYVIRTSVPVAILAAEDTVRAYKDLSTVERAFRSLKTVDLKVRPIFHRLANRVRAHILLCMLAYYVEWHMRRSLAPLLFDDEQPEVAETLRGSVVCPARRSPHAQRKAQTKHTSQGEPVFSFQGLLKNLATIVMNRVQLKGHGASMAEFNTLTVPTALQRRAFDLLGVKLAV